MGVDYIETDKTFVNPYHFIELARQLEKKFKYQDRKAEGKLTGWLECTLETKTPIFIPNTSNVFIQKVGDGDMKCYDFFSYTNLGNESTDRKLEDLPEPKPVIPGSEIRGMIRSAYEAVTNSCLSTIDDEQTLYKRVQSPAKPGQLMFENNQWKLIECKPPYKFPQSWITRKNSKIYINDQEYSEGQKVFIKTKFRSNKILKIAQKPGSDLKPGFLHVGECSEDENKEKDENKKKQYETVFVHKKDKRSHQKIEKPIGPKQFPSVIGNLIENLLLYREKQNKTKGHNQYSHFHLNESQLRGVLQLVQRCTEQKVTAAEFNRRLQHDFRKVFEYLNGALIYFVPRRGIHGERYYLSPAAIGREVFYSKLTDLIGNFTPCTQINHLCEACALYGIAGKEEAATSRVRFTDAHVQGTYQFDQPQTLKELASPKLSATEFYLKQTDSNAHLWNYDYAINWNTHKGGIPNYTPEIRGRKFYWHQKDADVEHKGKLTERNVHVRPLKSGTFSFKVYFNNITEDELLKLLWVLEIGGKDSHAHKIGMGKPIGLGSVQIRVDTIKLRDLNLVDESVQYKIDDTYEKPDYSEVEKGKFPHQKIVEQFLRITNFDDAPANVFYPYNEAIVCEETPDGKSPTYQWFGANKQIQGTDETGTAPVIYKALPKWNDEHFPELPVYKAQE